MPKEINLNQSFQMEGYWFPATDSSDRLPGVLTCDPIDGLRIDLSGVFHENDSIPSVKSYPSEEIEPIIQGFTQDGNHVYLMNCHGPGIKMSVPGYEISHYRAEIALIYDQEFPFTCSEEITLAKVATNFTGLQDWLGISGFQHETRQSKDSELEIITRFKPQRQRERLISHFKNGKIHSQLNVRIDPRGHTNTWAVSWKQTTFLEIETSRPQNILWFRDKIQVLQNFLAILTHEAIFPVIVKVEGITGDLDQTRSPTGYMYFATYNRNQDFQPWAMLLSARDLGEEHLYTALQSWFDKQDFITILSDLYLGLMYNKQFPRFAFLALVQSLEGYHREKFGGEYISTDEYAPYYDRMVSSLPEELPDEMKLSLQNGMLRFANQFSLRKRLKQLFSILEEEIRNLICIDKNYLGQIVDTRNQFAHHLPDVSNKILSGDELRTANLRLTGFLLALILKELELPSTVIVIALQRMKQYYDLS